MYLVLLRFLDLFLSSFEDKLWQLFPNKQKAFLFFFLQAFFDKDYITKHPADAEKITQLKELMQEQVLLFRHKRTLVSGFITSQFKHTRSNWFIQK